MCYRLEDINGLHTKENTLKPGGGDNQYLRNFKGKRRGGVLSPRYA